MALALLDDDNTIEVRDADLGLDGGDEETVYTLRVVSPQVIKRLRAANTKPRPTGGRGMEPVLNTDKFGEELWDYVLKSWTGPTWKGQSIGADDMVQTSGGPVKAKTQLDGSRKAALLERAGANEVVTDADSFRPSA